jgi:hypothetical protein
MKASVKVTAAMTFRRGSTTLLDDLIFYDSVIFVLETEQRKRNGRMAFRASI